MMAFEPVHPMSTLSSIKLAPAAQLEQEDLYGKKMLPEDFVPSKYSVILGRGKKCTEACGNRRLRVIAMMFLGRYTNATTKDAKSIVVSEIVATVQAACEDERGAFVRNCGGRWVEVDSVMAREKIGQVLRDLLSHKYRSSVKNKVAVRRNRRNAARNSISSTDSDVIVPISIFQ